MSQKTIPLTSPVGFELERAKREREPKLIHLWGGSLMWRCYANAVVEYCAAGFGLKHYLNRHHNKSSQSGRSVVTWRDNRK